MRDSSTKPHRHLLVWQESIELTMETYRTTKTYPAQERYNLVSQMQRCAASVPANIAEGAARQSAADFSRFLHIARGSLSELDTHLEISRKLGYISPDVHRSLDSRIDPVGRLLTGLTKSLRPAS